VLLDLAAAGADCEIVLKQEREMAVRALLNGRDVLAALPIGYGPKKRPFNLSWVRKDFKKYCTVLGVNLKAV